MTTTRRAAERAYVALSDDERAELHASIAEVLGDAAHPWHVMAVQVLVRPRAERPMHALAARGLALVSDDTPSERLQELEAYEVLIVPLEQAIAWARETIRRRER